MNSALEAFVKNKTTVCVQIFGMLNHKHYMAGSPIFFILVNQENFRSIQTKKGQVNSKV